MEMAVQEKWSLKRWQSNGAPGWVISTVIHAAVLLVFSTITYQLPGKVSEAVMESEVAELPDSPAIPVDVEPLPLAPAPQTLETQAPDASNKMDVSAAAPAGDGGATASDMEAVGPVTSTSLASLTGNAANLPVGKAKTEGFSSSRGTGKNLALATGGGTQNTEFAVTSGLDWMIKHQFPDGAWHIDYSPKSTGPTTGIGDAKSDMAATALALLPFLAANHTHKTGPHRAIVKKAIEWMVSNQQGSGLMLAKSDSMQFEMYTHGLATIVLCEAYALTKDKNLLPYAQKAVAFTCKVQNKIGAWHYVHTMQTADTSVFGWQMMSLKSAQMAGIEVPERVFAGAKKYLEAVSLPKQRGLYGYMISNPLTVPAMTSIGTLVNQYMGKPRNDPDIQAGIKFLLTTAPPEKTNDPYYWYYSTQVIHHNQGPEWIRWNRAMRRIWVERQNRDRKSTDFGSWSPKEFGGEVKTGGRLYLTSLGLLTLEVYYRYLPLYESAGREEKMANSN